jgi:hypothetical protein
MRFEYGKELRRMRDEAGVLLKEVGAAVHPPVTMSYLSQIELGTKPPLDITRTRQAEKFLLTRLNRAGKKQTSKLILFEVCYRLAVTFEGLPDDLILKLGKEIARELYDYG